MIVTAPTFFFPIQLPFPLPFPGPNLSTSISYCSSFSSLLLLPIALPLCLSPIFALSMSSLLLLLLLPLPPSRSIPLSLSVHRYLPGPYLAALDGLTALVQRVLPPLLPIFSAIRLNLVLVVLPPLLFLLEISHPLLRSPRLERFACLVDFLISSSPRTVQLFFLERVNWTVV